MLHHYTLNREPDRMFPCCGFDFEMGVVIHRFDLGKRKCRCGDIEIGKPEGFGTAPIRYGRGRKRTPMKPLDN